MDWDFDEALNSEIRYLQEAPSRSVTIKNGIQLSANYYKFPNEFALSFASETAALFTIEGNEYHGFIEHCDKESVELFIFEYNEYAIATVNITVATWKLMESLRLKLRNTNPNKIAKMIQDAHVKGLPPITEIMKGQDKAVDFALNNPITVIWGPPGTGKTYTLANIAIKHMLNGKRVLMMSQSNISVDGAILQILKVCKEQHIEWSSKIFRYGLVKEPNLQKCHDVQIHDFTLSKCPMLMAKLEDVKEKMNGSTVLTREELNKCRFDRKRYEAQLVTNEHDYLQDARIVATTATKATVSQEIYGSKWDVVIFDEVSMAMVPQIFVAASYAQEKLVLLGDFRQLAPIVRGKSKLLKTDIFEYIHVTKNGLVQNHPWLVMLDEQRRMHRDIAKISNEHIYNGLIKTNEEAARRGVEIASNKPFTDQVFSFIDYGFIKAPCFRTPYGSTFNVLSAMISLKTAIEATCKNTLSVGIITPYAAQAGLLNEMLKDYERTCGETSIFCATVHQFQGFEKDVIIFDTVETNPKLGVGQLFHDDEGDNASRLINVALTRSKGKFIVVGDYNFLSTHVTTIDPVIWAVINHSYKKCHLNRKKDIIDYIGTSFPTFGICDSYPSAVKMFRDDLYKTRDRGILVHAERNKTYKPGYTLREFIDDFKSHSKTLDRGLRLAAYASEKAYSTLPAKMRTTFVYGDAAADDLILLDRFAMWFNMPSFQNRLMGDSLPYYVHGESTTAYIFKALDLANRAIGFSWDTPLKKYLNKRLGVDDIEIKISKNKTYYYYSKKLGKTSLPSELNRLIEDYMEEKNIVCKVCKGKLKITKFDKVKCSKDFSHDTGTLLKSIIFGSK